MDNIQFNFDTKFRRNILIAIAVLSIVSIISFFHTPVRFWVNILINNFYFTSMALSGLFFLALQFLTNSSWMRTYQTLPLAMSSYLPIAFILSLFGLFGIHTLYEWSHTDFVMNDPILVKKIAYLNTPFFVTRIIMYFSLWLAFSYVIKKLIAKWRGSNKRLLSSQLATVSAFTMITFALSFSFYSYDSLMSLEPHWFSTIYSVYTFTSLFLGGIAFITLSLIILRQMGYMKNYVTLDHFHDLGKWLFGMSVFWAYIWFCQYLLIWYSNIPEETQYYVLREHGNWTWLFWSNFIISFLFPFFILLTRGSKRNLINLAITSLIVLIGRWVDLFTLVAPKVYEHSHTAAIIGPYEILSAFLFALVFIYFFLKNLSSNRLVLRDDPFFEEGQHLEQ